MKKFDFYKIGLLLAAIICFPLLFVGCASKPDKLCSYFISATYTDAEKSLTCHQEVNYVNNSDNKLEEVCFFLYANAFAEGQKPVSTSYENKAYPNGKSYGNISFDSVKVDGSDATFLVDETDGSILSVKLENGLFPNECASISLDFTVKLANIRHRLGYADDTINFGNFFPIACVYENGFVKNKFAANGDPFYSDVANFEVQITFPSTFTLASTGQQVEECTEGQNKIVSCKADKVRDFCFVLSEKFEKLCKKAGQIEVNYFFYDDANAQQHLDTAVKAVETFEELFGKYAYPQLSVVKSDFCFGGMEYPNLVLIADDLDSSSTEDYVIVHEIAHQWWYGMVGNNEFSEAWVDEGLTEYSCALFYEKNTEYGMKYDTIMQNATETYQNFVRIFKNINGQVDESMNRNLSQFATEPEYVNCTYTKGMLLFDCVRSTMSERKFFACLKNYFSEYAFKNSSSQKLVESFSKSAHINLEKFFDSWISGEVRIGG